MDELKETIAKNLVHLRTQAKLTQLQLAQMLDYSDKAVSKWERGEAIPDIRVLVQLAQFYNVTLDDIVRSDAAAKKILPKLTIRTKRILITVLSAVLVWFVATAVFAVFYLIDYTQKDAYMVFIVAPFAMSVVLIVFSALWGNRITCALSSSMALWTFVLIFHIFVVKYTNFNKIYILYVVAAVFEVLIILWFVFLHVTRKKK